jgi:hypothetical protein
VTYFNGHNEKYIEVRQRLQELARQVIAAPMPEKRKRKGKGKGSSSKSE